ncbi:MAG: hypothetical protein ACXVBJ_03460 [Flavisolibacter sp.]
MEVSKIHLSTAETELMQNAEIILTKNRVLEKIKTLLEEVQQKQTGLVEKYGSINKSGIFNIPPKISRGDNYLGLPYLILDYPRHSTQNSFFFIRTMFWWGNFFSCTLHVAKESKQNCERNIVDSYSPLKDYFIAVRDDEWVHHLQESDYRKIESFTQDEFDAACKGLDFIKIAYKHPLTEWQMAPFVLFEKWKLFLSVCGLVS